MSSPTIWAGWVWPVLTESVRDTDALRQSTPFQRFVFGEQVHGSTVTVIAPGILDVSSSDGLVAKNPDPGTGLTVRTADCLPILAYDSMTGVVGAAHAGWRGLAAGIVTDFFKTLIGEGSSKTNVRFLFGPHARSCCYEVDRDKPTVRSQFGGRGVFDERRGTTYLNLASTAAEELRFIGVRAAQLDVDSRCTMHDRAQLPSWRRDRAFARNHSIVGVIGMVHPDRME